MYHLRTQHLSVLETGAKSKSDQPSWRQTTVALFRNATRKNNGAAGESDCGKYAANISSGERGISRVDGISGA